MRATPVDSIIDARETPGAIKFYGAAGAEGAPITGMHFVCPCGCKEIGAVSFEPGRWTWNGDQNAPIISPSIYFEQGRPGEWHGHLGGPSGLQPGEWVQC